MYNFKKRVGFLKFISILAGIILVISSLITMGTVINYGLFPHSDSEFTVKIDYDAAGIPEKTRISSATFEKLVNLSSNIMKPVSTFDMPISRVIILMGLIFFIYRIPFFFICWWSYKYFDLMSTSRTPFDLKVVQYIKNIGMLLIGYGIFGQLLMSIMISMLVTKEIYINNPLNGNYVIIGLVVFFLYDVMRYGNLLQDEVDTIL